MKVLDVFKGLTREYFFRQLFFGVVVGSLFIYMSLQGENPRYDLVITSIISTLLYPYSRFTYETIMNFILGNNIFIHNALIFMLWKALTMILCWFLAIFIAPVGLIFIYFHQKKQQ